MAGTLLKKVVGTAALMAIATVLSGCYTYEVKMTYKCVSPPTGTNTMCMEWEQAGGVKTPTTCFPGDATVITRTGVRSMSDLKIGDEILGMANDGKQVFSPVRAWIHRNVHAETSMTSVESAKGTLIASPRHSIATGSTDQFKYEFASELQEGSLLLAQDGTAAGVTGVSETRARGLYAPLTSTSNFFVGGPQMKTAVLAHNFAELRYPRRFDGIIQRLISAAEFVKPTINEVTTKDGDYIHPVFATLMKLVGPWVMERESWAPAAGVIV
jgi:hypothetical protein